MSLSADHLSSQVYKIVCGDGRAYVVYNASVLENPADHQPNKWYVSPYPVRVGLEAGEAFDTPEDAEQAARDMAVWSVN